MRVVSGAAKGRRLKSPKTPGTRPVMDRVKTALFDILGDRVAGARFLDLFAGTGSVGIEALSRGAASATFIELCPPVVRLIRENLALTGLAPRAETLRADAFRFLASAAAAGRRYDLIYVAPPQYEHLAARALARLDAEPLAAPGSWVVAQVHPVERADLDALTLRHLHRVDERRYGSTLLVFYEQSEGEGDDPAKPAGEVFVRG